MDLNDFVLKQRVNFALARDPRVRPFDIGVRADKGKVTLEGRVATPADARIAEQTVSQVSGVVRITNDLMIGVDDSERAEFLIQRLLLKLQTEWEELPGDSALLVCEYMRWALWMVHKFHVPESADVGAAEELKREAAEAALDRISGWVGISPVMLAWIMHEQAEQAASNEPPQVPDLQYPPLAASPAYRIPVAAA